MPRGQFDFHARNAFLTYPQCDISPRDALAFISEICGTRAQFTCISHEFHEDGGDHLHVLIHFKVRVASLLIISHVTNSGVILTAKIQNQERAIF